MKYYAVKKGRQTGIFTDWDTCKEQVQGYPGAIYKSFKLEKDALDWINDAVTKKIETIKPTKSLTVSPIAYVDGSYMDEVSKTCVGSGVILILPNGEEISISDSIDDAEFAKMRQVGGEMRAAELAVEKAIENGCGEIIICYDYKGIACWATGEWKTNNIYTAAYAEKMRSLGSQIEITFNKVEAHSGNKYNDIADILAKRSITKMN